MGVFKLLPSYCNHILKFNNCTSSWYSQYYIFRIEVDEKISNASRWAFAMVCKVPSRITFGLD